MRYFIDENVNENVMGTPTRAIYVYQKYAIFELVVVIKLRQYGVVRHCWYIKSYYCSLYLMTAVPSLRINTPDVN